MTYPGLIGPGRPSAALDVRWSRLFPPGTELALAERQADWARARGANGWTGWVDGRQLQPRYGGLVSVETTYRQRLSLTSDTDQVSRA